MESIQGKFKQPSWGDDVAKMQTKRGMKISSSDNDWPSWRRIWKNMETTPLAGWPPLSPSTWILDLITSVGNTINHKVAPPIPPHNAVFQGSWGAKRNGYKVQGQSWIDRGCWKPQNGHYFELRSDFTLQKFHARACCISLSNLILLKGDLSRKLSDRTESDKKEKPQL